MISPSKILLDLLSKNLGWKPKTQALIVAGFLSNYCPIDVKDFVDETLRWAENTKLPLDIVIAGLCEMADTLAEINKSNFMDHLRAIAQRYETTKTTIETTVAKLEPEEPPKPEPAITEEIAMCLGPLWLKETTELLNMTSPVDPNKLGAVLSRTGFTGKTFLDEICVDVIDASPSPVLDVYLLIDGQTVCSVQPLRTIPAEFVLTHDSVRYRVTTGKVPLSELTGPLQVS